MTPARLDLAGRVAPVPMLAASVLLAVLSDFHSDRLPVGYVVTGAAAAWSLLIAWSTSRVRPVARSTFTGLWPVHVALAAVLVWVNPWFGIFAFTGYLLVEALPATFARPACALNALVVAASQTLGYPFGGSAARWVTYVFVWLVNTSLVIVFLEVDARMKRQSAERAVMIEKLNATLAENAGLHAQLVEQAREAGVQDERQRLAGEIHDTLAQALIGIIRQLEAAETVMPADRARAHLARARTAAQHGLTEARRSVQALRPEQVERAGLDRALCELAAGWSAESGVAAPADTVGTAVPLPAAIEDALFRMTQEALTNVGRHAHASRVRVTLTYLDDVVLLDVRDDGVGWTGEPRDGGYGLAGMRERLVRVGGTLSVETAPGEGTAVSACVPT